MVRALLLVTALMSMTTSVAAQMSIAAGVGIGQQQYASWEDHNKVVSDLDLLFEQRHIGLHVDGQYADLSTIDGPLIAVHPDLVYRMHSGLFRLLLGAGPSFIRVGSTVTETTWNVEAELARALGRTDVFVRARQFDFSIASTRAGEAGPTGPVISIGARFRLRG